MIVYKERGIEQYPLAKEVLAQFSQSQILEVSHYKNLFDKRISYTTEKCLFLAKSDQIKIFPVPDNYGYGKRSFFFVTQLNCVYNCAYCYLKWCFKNQFPVVFVNVSDMQSQMKTEIEKLNPSLDNPLVLYASNYSDMLATEWLSHFHRDWIPFFEQFEWVLVESRTKSANIKSLLEMETVPQNMEIAFSLNPQDIVVQYEHGTSPLEQRIQAIEQLLAKWWKVWLRFLPLLPVDNYVSVYREFLEKLVQRVDIEKINSIFIATMIYNQQDWKSIQKKESDFLLLQEMEICDDGLVRVSTTVRENFESLFREFFGDKIRRDY